MPYMLAPGARLMVGPGGQLEESLGDVMSVARAIASKAGGKGANIGNTSKAIAAVKAANPGMTHEQARAVVLAPRNAEVSAIGPIGGGSRKLMVYGAAAVVGLGLLYVVVRKRKGRRR